MRYPKALRLGAVLALGVAFFASPVAASGATSATVHFASSTVHVQTMIPQEKVHFGFTGYSFADTKAGRSACESKGVALTRDGWGYGPSCVDGNPDKGRWNLWMWLYG